ncbi:hypothetical protein KEM55_008437, partial [Ascosphaera atra]
MSVYRQTMDLGAGMHKGYLSTQPYSHGTSSLFPTANTHLTIQHDACDLEPPVSHDYPEGYFACPDFFKFLSPAHFRSRPSRNSWQYEDRRAAQQITPYLYLGPVAAAKDADFLAREGITLLLAVRSRDGGAHPQFVNGDRAAAALGIQSRYIEVDNEQELISIFQIVIRQVNDHVCRCAFHRTKNSLSEEPLRKVLVFCESGNGRSAAIVAAYLMAMYQIDAEKAISNVVTRRMSTALDEPTRRALQAFDDIITATRSVTRASGQIVGATNLGTVELPPPGWSINGAAKKRDS